MQKECKQCQSGFTVDERDQAFYEKMKVPAPTFCPDCRLQRRLSWRVERVLYMNKCGATGKKILSQFPPGSSYKSYFHEAWYGDGWNAKDYGRDFDFSRPFFEQFDELIKSVPLLATNVVNLQNCDFLNQCGWSKNCYFTIEADHNQDSMYGYRVFFNKTFVDCTEMITSERCYECIDCEKCFQLKYSQLCEQCSDSSFLFDCRSCSYCFGCTGLRQKKFCMFNEQLKEEEYKEKIAMFDFSNREHISVAQNRFDALKGSQIRKAFIGEQNDNVTGNYIYESKDCFDCFGIRGCRDCRYCQLVRDSKDCMDVFVFGDKTERVYESECCGENLNNVRFCTGCFSGAQDLTYCFQCIQTTAHCFGCVGLKKQEYCILNKQYTKREYEEMIPKIIEHMKKTDEWGEFFPASISPYSYNETTANEYFPLSKEDVVKCSLKWQDNLPFTKGKETISWDDIPDDIDEVPDSIIDEIIACKETGKNYRITKQELTFYRNFRIPIPKLHPDERHKRRIQLRNPRKLWKRECGKCGEGIDTTYAPDREEIVYCEKCYLDTVY
ncbi:hypothetical protein HOF56_04890 [Candidatus Peribacteria bacterium]|jgi:hypothetical protein|nr:hypothetical protein [Candidatus Peribacteria bacterium]MBT4021473.1 hypothetical protein [Candidatus Peribacteria bacterium]MBT4240383.1 hypothetical protein [Candidatus Peribacteria bacterium]MBT4473806.1 hypothetical protein [Candidatus Peribacteria bacterium]